MRRSLPSFVVIAAGLVIGGCLSPEAMKKLAEERQAKVRNLEQEVMEEMKPIVSRLTANDFKPCIERLHSPNFWGGEYRVSSEFHPSPRFSCIVQGRGEALTTAIRGNDGKRFAVYSVQLKKVGGGFGSGERRKTAYCMFKWENGTVSFVTGNHEMKVHRGNSCLVL